MVIGVTGGIGGGKTTICDLLRQKDYPVYDTDAAGKRLQNEDKNLREAIIQLLGPASYTGAALNRPFVASVVFPNPVLLQTLNRIVHPAVIDDFKKWKANFSSDKLLFLECAVLFEANFMFLVDKIIVVTASEELRIERVMKRDGLSREDVEARMKNQISETQKINQADYIINTDGYILPEEQLQNILTIIDL